MNGGRTIVRMPEWTAPQSEFLYAPQRYPAYFGGFGNGKTLAGCWRGLLYSLYQPGNVGVVGRLTYPELRDSTRRTFLEIAAPFQAGWKEQENLLTVHCVGGGTSQVMFRHMDDLERLLSMNLGWFYLDQAEELPEEAFLTLAGRLRLAGVKQRSGWITGNPAGHDWIYRRWKAEKAEDYRLIEATTMENPHLPADYVENLLKNYPEHWVKRYVYGSWDVFEGQIWPDYDERMHVIDPIQVPKDWEKIQAIDHGFTNPTCCLWAAVDYDGNIIVYDEHYEAGQLVSHHAEAIKSRGELSGITYIDPSTSAKTQQRGGYLYSIAYEYSEHGIYTVPANNNVQAGILRVSELLRPSENRRHIVTGSSPAPGLYITRNCVNLRRELPQYQWKRLRLGQNQNMPEEPVKSNDHACDALRYLCMSRPQTPEAPKKPITPADIERKFLQDDIDRSFQALGEGRGYDWY